MTGQARAPWLCSGHVPVRETTSERTSLDAPHWRGCPCGRGTPGLGSRESFSSGAPQSTPPAPAPRLGLPSCSALVLTCHRPEGPCPPPLQRWLQGGSLCRVPGPPGLPFKPSTLAFAAERRGRCRPTQVGLPLQDCTRVPSSGLGLAGFTVPCVSSRLEDTAPGASTCLKAPLLASSKSLVSPVWFRSPAVPSFLCHLVLLARGLFTAQTPSPLPGALLPVLLVLKRNLSTRSPHRVPEAPGTGP